MATATRPTGRRVCTVVTAAVIVAQAAEVLQARHRDAGPIAQRAIVARFA